MICEVGKRGGKFRGDALDWRESPAKIGRRSPRPHAASIGLLPGHSDIHRLNELQQALWAE